jgi:hypothetical protein
MDSIQFTGFVANVSAKWGTGAVTVKLLCKLKNISEADREKLGLWARAEDPKVDLVGATSRSDVTIELEDGELAGAKIDLASQKLATSIRFNKTAFDEKAENTLTALLRFPEACNIEIKYAQLSFTTSK